MLAAIAPVRDADAKTNPRSRVRQTAGTKRAALKKQSTSPRKRTINRSLLHTHPSAKKGAFLSIPRPAASLLDAPKAKSRETKAKVTRAKKQNRANSRRSLAQRAKASLTRKLDRLEAKSPKWARPTLQFLRTYSVFSLGAFAAHRVKSDKTFLGTYLIGNAVISYGALPTAVLVGLDPVLAGTISLAMSPLTAVVLVAREQNSSILPSCIE